MVPVLEAGAIHEVPTGSVLRHALQCALGNFGCFDWQASAKQTLRQHQIVVAALHRERALQQQVLLVRLLRLAEIPKHLAEQQARVVVLGVLLQDARQALLGTGQIALHRLLHAQQVVQQGLASARVLHQHRQPPPQEHYRDEDDDRQQDLDDTRLATECVQPLPKRLRFDGVRLFLLRLLGSDCE